VGKQNKKEGKKVVEKREVCDEGTRVAREIEMEIKRVAHVWKPKKRGSVEGNR